MSKHRKDWTNWVRPKKQTENYKNVSDNMFRHSGSFERMKHVLRMRRNLTESQFLTLLGECWNSCDLIWPHRRLLRHILGAYGPLRPMMTDQENAAWDALPDEVMIYRGCQEANIKGACWSLDRELAKNFTQLTRYKVDQPLLVSAKTRRKKVLAVKLDREENEIITFSPVVLRIDEVNHDPTWLQDWDLKQRMKLNAVLTS